MVECKLNPLKVLDEKVQYSLEVQVIFCAKLAGLLYTCTSVLVLLENYIGNQKNIGCSQKTPYKSGPYSLPLRKVLFEIVFEGPQAGTTGTTLKFFFL